MDPIYEAYRGGYPTHKLSLEIIEGPLKGNKKKFTYVYSNDNIRNYKVGDVIEINADNNDKGEAVKAKITKITKED